MCDMCNDYEIENARHYILQCPYFHEERDKMLGEIDQVIANIDVPLFQNDTDMLFTLLGRHNENLSEAH